MEEITTKEAAEILDVTPTHVRWYFAKGLLPGRRLGEHMLVFRRVDVESFVKPVKTGRPPKAAKPTKKPAKRRKGKSK